MQQGTYAEYTVLPDSYLAKAPEALAGAELATIPLVALTAWQGLFEVLRLKANETLLVTAGAGGVGSFAIQFAKAKGAKVIATASPHNHQYLKQLGADAVVDYKQDAISSH